MLQSLRLWCVARVPPPAHPAMSALFHGETPVQRTLSERFARVRTTPARRHMSGPQTFTAVQTWRGAMLATSVDRFNAAQVLEGSLALVVDALEAEHVPYVVFEARAMRRRVVVVVGDQGEPARQALQRHHRGDAVYVSAVEGDRSTGVPVLAEDLDRHSRVGRAGVLRIFRILAAGAVVLGSDDLGCDLELWPLVETEGHLRADGSEYLVGTAMAPRPNRRALYLTPSRRRPMAAVVGSLSLIHI